MFWAKYSKHYRLKDYILNELTYLYDIDEVKLCFPNGELHIIYSIKEIIVSMNGIKSIVVF